jgi:DNA-binding protein HU-beta
MAKKPMKKAAKKASKPAKTAKSAKKAAPKKAMVVARPQGIVLESKARQASRPRNSSTLSYTQSEFIENIRAFTGLPKRSHAKEVVEDIAAFITESLRKGFKLPLMGLGKLYVRQSKARIGRNPQTGEPVQIPARKRVRFTASKALKDSVLGR